MKQSIEKDLAEPKRQIDDKSPSRGSIDRVNLLNILDHLLENKDKLRKLADGSFFYYDAEKNEYSIIKRTDSKIEVTAGPHKISTPDVRSIVAISSDFVVFDCDEGGVKVFDYKSNHFIFAEDLAVSHCLFTSNSKLVIVSNKLIHFYNLSQNSKKSLNSFHLAKRPHLIAPLAKDCFITIHDKSTLMVSDPASGRSIPISFPSHKSIVQLVSNGKDNVYCLTEDRELLVYNILFKSWIKKTLTGDCDVEDLTLDVLEDGNPIIHFPNGGAETWELPLQREQWINLEIREIPTDRKLEPVALPVAMQLPEPKPIAPSFWAPRGGMTVSQFTYNYSDQIISFSGDKVFGTVSLHLEDYLGSGTYGDAYLYKVEISSDTTEAESQKLKTISDSTVKAEPLKLVVKIQKPQHGRYPRTEIYNEAICTLEQDGWVGFFGDVKCDKQKHILAKLYKSGKTLKELVDAKGIKNLEHYLQIATAIIDATNNFHQKGRRWVHGDIRSGNILVRELKDTEKVEADLIDYGMSRPIGELTKLINMNESYAPELKTQIKASIEQDVYALGFTLKSILDKCALPVNAELNSLLARMQNTDPKARPNLLEVKNALTSIQKSIQQSSSMIEPAPASDSVSHAKVQLDRRPSATLAAGVFATKEKIAKDPKAIQTIITEYLIAEKTCVS